MTEELSTAAIRAKWLILCAYCDAGMAMTCTCPTGDYRNAMSNLCDALDAARAEQHYSRVQQREAHQRCMGMEQHAMDMSDEMEHLRARAEAAAARIAAALAALNSADDMEYRIRNARRALTGGTE